MMRYLQLLLGGIAFALGWLRHHRRYAWSWFGFLAVALVVGRGFWSFVLLGSLVPIVSAAWVVISPASYERWVAGPGRRRSWRRYIVKNWGALARQCGLCRQVPAVVKVRGPHRVERAERMLWQAPRLMAVTADDRAITVRMACVPGQTVEELEAGAARLATAIAAETFAARQVSPCELDLTLMLVDELDWASNAVAPMTLADLSTVSLGRTTSDKDWRLPVMGRHTLVVGASGAGKGSLLWGVCCGLAPAVRDDRARLWGIDLKRGVELAMGRGLFSALVVDPDGALRVLRALIEVIDERGAKMAGQSRLHLPTAGDPLHVLVIDELAILTAYGESATMREANRLLGEILTQGRALGVVVLACVQDPRKEVVGLRGLFTQTVAMRLRSVHEVSMVLGEGMADAAPAHRILPTQQGTAFVVDDSGACSKVRADYWPDELVQRVATEFATPVTVELRPKAEPPEPAKSRASETAPRPRSPRKPRSRRTSRKESGTGEAA